MQWGRRVRTSCKPGLSDGEGGGFAGEGKKGLSG